MCLSPHPNTSHNHSEEKDKLLLDTDLHPFLIHKIYALPVKCWSRPTVYFRSIGLWRRTYGEGKNLGKSSVKTRTGKLSLCCNFHLAYVSLRTGLDSLIIQLLWCNRASSRWKSYPTDPFLSLILWRVLFLVFVGLFFCFFFFLGYCYLERL